MPYTSTERLYLTADDQVVKEGDERAVSLLIGVDGTLDDATAKRYKLKGGGETPETFDAIVDHEANHGGETEQEAEAKRKALFEKAPNTKAVSKAPANK